MIDCVRNNGVALWRDRPGAGNYRMAVNSDIKSEADIDRFLTDCSRNGVFRKGDIIRITTNNPNEYMDTVIRQVIITQDMQ